MWWYQTMEDELAPFDLSKIVYTHIEVIPLTIVIFICVTIYLHSGNRLSRYIITRLFRRSEEHIIFIPKITASLSELINYLTYTIWGFYVILYCENFYNLPELYSLSNKNYMTLGVRIYYIAYGLRYLVMLEDHINRQPRRKDFKLMAYHHGLTFFLVLISYLFGLTNVGSVIMCIFDVADVLLHSAKIVNYYKQDAKGVALKISSTVADIIFALFAITFLVTRLLVFGKVILDLITCHRVWDYYDYLTFKTLTPTLVLLYMLKALYIMQLIWSYSVLKAIYGVICKADLKDDLSDDEL